MLDENIIKKTFMLPSIESLEDLAEVTGDLMDDVEIGEINVEGENVDDTGFDTNFGDKLEDMPE
jgi:hypothetical protein